MLVTVEQKLVDIFLANAGVVETDTNFHCIHPTFKLVIRVRIDQRRQVHLFSGDRHVWAQLL